MVDRADAAIPDAEALITAVAAMDKPEVQAVYDRADRAAVLVVLAALVHRAREAGRVLRDIEPAGMTRDTAWAIAREVIPGE